VNVDLVSGLTLVVTALKEIVKAVRRAETSSKQRFLRQLAGLFEILDRADEDITRVNSNLQAFLDEEHTGMRVHYIHTAGLHLKGFSVTQESFFRWMRDNREARQDITVFSEDDSVRLSLSAIARLVGAHGQAGAVIRSIHDAQEELQATRTPNPARFPDPRTVKVVMDKLASLSEEIALAKRDISSFVCENFTIQDIFDADE
jgi:hypothetical protein